MYAVPESIAKGPRSLRRSLALQDSTLRRFLKYWAGLRPKSWLEEDYEFYEEFMSSPQKYGLSLMGGGEELRGILEGLKISRDPGR